MKNFSGHSLKNSIKNNILEALKTSKNVDLNISFIFTGAVNGDGKPIEFKEKISRFGGYFHFKGMTLNSFLVKEDYIIDLIVDNFHYDNFKFIALVKKIGKEQCHGHGEYWGTDIFTFVYTRI